MPYKARLKEGTERKRKKPGYRVTNCSAYNQSLKKRGQISLYFPAGELKSQFINQAPWTGFVRKGTRFLEVGGVMHSSRKRACQMRSTN